MGGREKVQWVRAPAGQAHEFRFPAGKKSGIPTCRPNTQHRRRQMQKEQ